MVPSPSIRAHLRAIMRLSLPLVGGLLAQMSMGLVDTLMLGWYGVDALAGQVLGSSLFFVLYIFGSGFAWAVMPLVASAHEAGDTTGLRRVTRMGLWISALVGLAMLPVLLTSEGLLRALGQDPHLAGIAQDYLRCAGWGLVPGLLGMVMRSYFTGLERPRVVMWVAVGGAAVNAALNYVLIFGQFGAPELGVRGAGIASASVFALSFALMAGLARARFPEHALFARLWRPDWAVFAEVARMGAHIGLTTLAEVGLFSASTLIMGLLGTRELAAHGIALQVTSFFFMVQVGLSNAATVRAGRALGRGDEAALRQGALVVTLLSQALALCVGVALVIWPDWFIGVFLAPDDPERAQIIARGRVLLRVAALFQLVDAAQVIAVGLLRGVRETRAPMFYAIFSYWAVGVPLSWLLGVRLGWGGAGVWAGLAVGLALAAALMMARFWRRASRLAPPLAA